MIDIGERFTIDGRMHRRVDTWWMAAVDCADEHPTESGIHCHLPHGHDGEHWSYDAPVDGELFTWCDTPSTAICGYGPAAMQQSRLMRSRVRQSSTSHHVARDGTAIVAYCHPESQRWHVAYIVDGLVRGQH